MKSGVAVTLRMLRRCRAADAGRSAVAIGLIFAMALTAAAQAPPDEVRQRLERQKEALREKWAAERDLAADVKQIQADRERLSADLVETARKIQAGEGQLTQIEGRLGELEAQEKLLRGSLAERHGSIVRLLGAMQRMGRDPPPVMITQREDALVMVRSAMMLAAAFPQLKTQALALASRLDELGRVMGDIRTQGERLRTETQRLSESRVKLAELVELRRQSLAERQGALDKVRKEAAEIARNVTDLNELIERLDLVVTRQAEEAAQSRTRPDLPAGLPKSDGGPHGAPADRPAPPTAVVMAPQDPKLANPHQPRIAPGIPFAQARGRVVLPVQGKRIIGFGDKAHTNRSNGIVIETRSGAQVVAPADGWIVFAGVFRSYGQILIINCGGGYHMLLAGLSQIDVQLGQFVLGGEPVGLMSGAALGARAKPPSNTPVLYIELRKDGRSIDPDPWWTSDGTQKVQG